MQDEAVRRLIDVTEVSVLTENELAQLGGQNGACIVEVFFDDGAELRDDNERPSGLFTGMHGAELAEHFRAATQLKQRIVEESYHYDLSSVRETIYSLDQYDGKGLLDALRTALAI
jgi:hypothetical protein